MLQEKLNGRPEPVERSAFDENANPSSESAAADDELINVADGGIDKS